MPLTVKDVEEDIGRLENIIQAADSGCDQLRGQIEQLQKQGSSAEVQQQIAELKRLKDTCAQQAKDAQREINRCKQKIRNITPKKK